MAALLLFCIDCWWVCSFLCYDFHSCCDPPVTSLGCKGQSCAYCLQTMRLHCMWAMSSLILCHSEQTAISNTLLGHGLLHRTLSDLLYLCYMSANILCDKMLASKTTVQVQTDCSASTQSGQAWHAQLLQGTLFLREVNSHNCCMTDTDCSLAVQCQIPVFNPQGVLSVDVIVDFHCLQD